MRDLVQIDIDTALALYLKGETHLRCLKPDDYSEDWTSMQPLYLDDILEGLTVLVSDKKRTELLNPPKVDVKAVKEDIAMEYKSPFRFRIDPEEDEEDDDPDWVETEPEQVESIPDDDEVPEFRAASIEEAEKREQKTDKEKVDELISEIQLGTREPFKWNAREAVRLNDNGISQIKLAELYGLSIPTVSKRIREYRSKS